jgi:tetratricopeptide (TPR) repeat protein
MPDNTHAGSSYGAVFLSYASQDAEAAKRICEALRSSGVEVWFDQNELVGGDQWDGKIRGQISSCALFVPIISANTQARLEGYFRLEWKLAAQRTHMMSERTAFLLPVIIDATREAEADVPGEFRSVQFTKLPGGETPPVFCARLKALLEREQGPHAGRPAAPTRGTGTFLPDKTRHVRFVSVVISLVVVASVAWWQPWKGRAPSVGPAPTALTPAAELREKVQALISRPNGTREDLDTATSLMEQVVRLEPTSAATWVEWVWLDLAFIDSNGDRSPSRMSAARDHLAQAEGLASDDYEVRLARAAVLMHMDNWNPEMNAEAEPQLRALLRERPDDGHTLLLLSWSLNSQGRLDEQLQLLDRAARLPAFAAQANLNRMAALFYGRRFDEAELIYSKMPPQSRPIDASVMEAAILCFWRGDLESAGQVLDGLPPSTMVDEAPGCMAFWVHFEKRDYDRALASIRRIPHDYIECPMFTGPNSFLAGLALAHSGRTEAAQAEWRLALQIVEQRLLASPNNQALLAFKIRLLAGLGEQAEAERLWRTARELYPSDQIGWGAVIAVNLGLPEQAMDLLAAELKNPTWVSNAAFLRLDPQLDPLRSLPRFKAMLAASEADPNLSPKARAAAKEPATP